MAINIKDKIIRWLGIDVLRCDLALLSLKISETNNRYKRMEETWSDATREIVDCGFKGGNTHIVVAAKFGKRTTCKIYDLRFENISELNDFLQILEHRQVTSSQPFLDAPYSISDGIRYDQKRRGMKRRKND